MAMELEHLFHGTNTMQEPTRSSRFAPKGSKLPPYPLLSPKIEIKLEHDHTEFRPNASAPLPLLLSPKKEIKLEHDDTKTQPNLPLKESADDVKPQLQSNLSSSDEIWADYSMDWSDYSMDWSEYESDDSVDCSENEPEDCSENEPVYCSEYESDDSVDCSENEPDDPVDCSENEPDDSVDCESDDSGDFIFKYVPLGSMKIQREAEIKEARPHFFSMSTYEYLQWFCPPIPHHRLTSKLRPLLALPLKQRFEKWLREEQDPPPHTFHTLLYLAPENSIGDVLTVLQELAVLVQGLWVLKTSLLYEVEQNDDSLYDLFYEELGGLGPFARNYVLYLFSKNATIKESQLPDNLRLAQVMEAALHKLAIRRHMSKDWILPGSPDFNFIQHYPTVVMDQQKEWEKVEADINNQLRSMNSISKSSMPTGVREAIKKALEIFFRSTKSCSIQQIRQRLRDIAVCENARINGGLANVAGNSIDEFGDELHTILNEVAVNIHGIYVPRSSPNHPEYDDFRNVVIELLVSEGPNAKLTKAPVYGASIIGLGKKPSQVAYQKVMQELCVCQGKSWSLLPLAST